MRYLLRVNKQLLKWGSILGALGIISGVSFADGVVQTTNKREYSASYCGIYCLYTVVKAEGKAVNFKEFLNPKYIGSSKGSSLAELKTAAEDHGMYAAPVGNMTSRELRDLNYPMILHVKSDANSQTYNHFVLFLGTKDGQASLYDPPYIMKQVPFAELVPRWDGTGLIVSASPIDMHSIFAPTRNRFFLYGVIVIFLILIGHFISRRLFGVPAIISRRSLFGLSIVQAVGFFAFAGLAGMIYHFLNDEGFLAYANGTASTTKAYQSTFIPKISDKEVRQYLNNGVCFIDARFPKDFKAGHLNGAINVPVNASAGLRRKATTAINKDARIVVYCQSASCKFAEKVAVDLIMDGFKNVVLFKGGWQEWMEKKEL